MARYILIDNGSGYIFGDTADINGRVLNVDSPIDAARALDEQVVGEHGRTYHEVGRLAANETGYHVYRADIQGGEAVPVVENGQDAEMIATVERECEFVATIRCSAEAE